MIHIYFKHPNNSPIQLSSFKGTMALGAFFLTLQSDVTITRLYITDDQNPNIVILDTAKGGLK